jgi:hypothetical protein
MGVTGGPVTNVLGVQNSTYAYGQDHATNWPWQINIQMEPMSIPADATIIGAEVLVRAFLSVGSPIKSVLVGMENAGYMVRSWTTATETLAYGQLTSWSGGSTPWAKPAPAAFADLLLTLGPAGYYSDNRHFQPDFISIRVKYSTPPQTLNLAPAVMKFRDPLQTATKADPSDPVGYTNEHRAGDRIRKVAVDKLRYRDDTPTSLTKGNVWLDPGNPGVKIWTGTEWRQLVQPGAILLGTQGAKSTTETDWVTIQAYALNDVPSTYGFSWMVTGLTSGANARVRVNQDDAKIWAMTDHGTFAMFESQNVKGVGHLWNTVGDYIISDDAFTLPTEINLIEFQMRRVDASTPNAITSMSMWAHPR